MVLEAVMVLPHTSVALQLSVTVPPQAPEGVCALKVEVALPLIKQEPIAPLL